jgi:hypothetical protein
LKEALECIGLAGHLVVSLLVVELLLAGRSSFGAGTRLLLGFAAWPLLASSGLFLRLLGAELLGIQARQIELAAIAIVTLVLIAVALRRQRQSVETPPPRARWPALLAVVVLLALACALASFVLASLRSPHGGWDAWITWNLRARQLFLAGDDWRSGFAVLPAIHHPDYPLLLPGFVARLWHCAGTEWVAASVLVAMFFTFGTVAVASSALGALRGGTHATLAALALLGTPFLIELGALQYADVPLAFFVLSALAAFAEALERASKGAWVLAGLLAGAAAWTKNEGLLLAPSLAVVSAVAVARVHGIGRAARSLGLFLSGLLPAAVPVVLFKLFVTAENDLVSASRIDDIAASLGDPSRYATVLGHMLGRAVSFAGVAPLLLVGLVLGLRLVRGRNVPPRQPSAVPAIATTLALLLAAYALSYVITPHPLRWHLATSLDRLLLQLWPASVLAVLLAVPGSPEPSLTSPPPPPSTPTTP